MIHSTQTMTRIGTHKRFGVPIWQCPDCKVKIVGEQPQGQCRGADPVIVGGARNLDCIHRLEKVGTIPCETCTTRTVKAVVYGCRANGGQTCTLYAIGTGPEQLVDGKQPVNCAVCKIREAPKNLEG